jgi:UDP-glucose 4-epimerase
MKILITGGNGYVGRTLTRRLYREHQVSVLDNLRHGGLRFSREEEGRFALFRTDLRDSAEVGRVVAETQPEVVIHLAAIHYIPECERHPDEAIAVNTLGTSNLLRACTPGTRFVLASTAAVYAVSDAPHVESSSRVEPVDIYGLTKLHAEDYVRYWARANRLDARIVRLFNVIGPGETNPHILPAILAQVLKGSRTLRLGNCHPRRDYIHVADAAGGFAAVALDGRDSARVGVDVVNLGTGESHSVYDLVDGLGAVIGEPLTIEVDPERTRASDRPFLAADPAKMRREYHWSPRSSLIDSLRDLWLDPDIPPELLERC